MGSAAGANHQISPEKALLSGRVAIVYALSGRYLFLPFAALCTLAVLLKSNSVYPFALMPLFLMVAATFAAGRLKAAYSNRKPNDDPALWARRFVILSAVSGLIWGLGAFVWFLPGLFAPQAYLALAFLGMSATEFIVRAAYRPAYLAHAAGSLLPLVLLLLHEGGIDLILCALLVLFFGGGLYFSANMMAKLLTGSILVPTDTDTQLATLSEDKRTAEEARDTAQARERVRSAFISNISHELRTPLNAMLGMAQLLERSDLEKAQRDHIKILLEAGRGLKTLLDDIIALAHHADEPLSSPEEGCDAAQAARTVARLLQPNAWEKRLRLSVNIASALPRVAADSRLLRRLLLKLVGNAIKFTERGNIEVALDSITDESGARSVRFTVNDTGPGIPPHLIATIFEPFAKNEDRYASRHAGAGVGLAVAKRLVESIGGRIGVESEPGMGARFWITMPAMQSTVSELAREEEPVSPPGGLSLLIHLPDEAMQSSVERLLTPFGNAITIAGNLAQAATIAARGGFALIIAGAGSVDALAAIPGQRTPILGLITREERKPQGADIIVRWPSRANDLYSAIASVTEGAKDGQAAKDDTLDSTIDAKAVAELEKSLGLKTLIDILHSYLHTAEELAATLTAASENADRNHTGRVAQDFAGAAGGLGLTALTSAARLLAQGARDGLDHAALAAATDDVLSEHRRVREALRRLYPDLSA